LRKKIRETKLPSNVGLRNRSLKSISTRIWCRVTISGCIAKLEVLVQLQGSKNWLPVMPVGIPIQHPGQQKSIFRLLEHARTGNLISHQKKVPFQTCHSCDWTIVCSPLKRVQSLMFSDCLNSDPRSCRPYVGTKYLYLLTKL
jgi:hypothetical protein